MEQEERERELSRSRQDGQSKARRDLEIIPSGQSQDNCL
jgi:hypothetical protein